MQDRRHKEGRELAHGQTYGDWTIRRQPSSEMERSGIELGHGEKRRGQDRRHKEGGDQNDKGKGRRHQ